MRATIPYIQEKFDTFNAQYFEGKLPPIPIRTNHARTYLGQIQYRRTRRWNGQWVYSDFQFVISTLIDREEAVVEDTILHEMIHYYILVNGIEDTSAHGEVFKRIMTHINRQYNRHISISHRTTAAEHASDTRARIHYICVSKLQDGTEGITIAMPSHVGHLRRDMARFPGLTDQYWVISHDPYFNRYPRCKTCKIYPISPDILAQYKLKK